MTLRELIQEASGEKNINEDYDVTFEEVARKYYNEWQEMPRGAAARIEREISKDWNAAKGMVKEIASYTRDAVARRDAEIANENKKSINRKINESINTTFEEVARKYYGDFQEMPGARDEENIFYFRNEVVRDWNRAKRLIKQIIS